MSQIPFVDRLGDAIDAAVADQKTRPTATSGRTRRRGRRLALLAAAAVLAAGGTVAAARILTAPEKLAATEIDCYYDPVQGGGIGINPRDQDPVTACAEHLARHGDDRDRPAPASLIACVRPEVGKVVVIAGTQGDCERHALDPLPTAYGPAREKVAKLERDLQAIERGADCIPPQELARQVQALLDRSGWAGWSTSLRPDRSDGPCGHVLDPSETDGRALVPDPHNRQLAVWGEPPAATIALLNELSPALAKESVTRCFTLDRLKAHVRQRVAPTGRQVTFKVFRTLLPGKQLTGSAGARYAAGCAILEKVGPDPNGHDLVALIHKKR
jgi:hypothetical protein